MFTINDLKNGTVFEENGQPWLVLEYQHSKMGRGGAVLKTKLKNLITGAVVAKTFQGSDKFMEVNLERKRAQYLYQEGEFFVFMDSATYEQFNLGKEIVGSLPDFVKEGEEIQLQYYKEKPINIDIPIKVKLQVAEAAETDKGNTATAATKTVKLETGLSIQAPLFVKKGDTLVVDTRNSSYVERA